MCLDSASAIGLGSSLITALVAAGYGDTVLIQILYCLRRMSVHFWSTAPPSTTILSGALN